MTRFKKIILIAALAALVTERSFADERILSTKPMTADEYASALFAPSETPAPRYKTRGLLVLEQPAAPQPVAAAEPAPAPAPVAAPPAPAPQTRIVAMPINFGLDSSAIPAVAQTELVKLAIALKSPEAQGKLVVITGHTDTSGSASHNMMLSVRRAAAVEAFLLAQGVRSEQMISAGKGMLTPLPGKDGRDSDNRRVEFAVTSY